MKLVNRNVSMGMDVVLMRAYIKFNTFTSILHQPFSYVIGFGQNNRFCMEHIYKRISPP